MSDREIAWDLPTDVVTAPEAAAEKGVHRNSVLKAIRKGHLQARKSGKLWIISRPSLDRWEPKGQSDRPRSTPKIDQPPAVLRAQESAAQRKARVEELMRVLDEWIADENSNDEETWPKLKAILEQDRLSSRPLFDETRP
jgi:excisionase family DNA binding protein